MNKKIYLKYIVVLMMLITSELFSHTYEKMGIEIIHPWCTPGIIENNSKAYLTISNNSENNVNLMKITSENIVHIMLLNLEGKNLDKLLIPAGSIRGSDDFQIMFHGLKSDMIKGESIDANLVFDNQMIIKVKFVVGESTMLDSEDETEEENHNHH